MLNILFVPGSFGTTIQFLIYKFSLFYLHPDAPDVNGINLISDDGSMHKFNATGHTMDKEVIENFFNGKFDDLTKHSNLLIYAELGLSPYYDYKWFLSGISTYRKNDQNVFVIIENIKQAELCLLFQYNKKDTANTNSTILNGYDINGILILWGLDIINFHQKSYIQLLDEFSDHYPTMINKWIDAKTYASNDWLLVNINEMLESTFDTFTKIIDYCGGLADHAQYKELQTFSTVWREKQQYILDQYETIDTIAESVISGKSTHTWNTLNFMAESILLQKLKAHGYNISNETRRPQ